MAGRPLCSIVLVIVSIASKVLATDPTICTEGGTIENTVSNKFNADIYSCQNISGVLKVFSDYPGELVLPNLKSINGEIQSITDATGGPADTSSNLTGISCPALQSCPSILIGSDPILKVLDFPSLWNTTSISLTDLQDLAAVNFSLLGASDSVTNFRRPTLSLNVSISNTSTTFIILGSNSFADSSSNLSLPSIGNIFVDIHNNLLLEKTDIHSTNISSMNITHSQAVILNKTTTCGSITVSNCSTLSALELTDISTLDIEYNGMTELSMPKITSIDGHVTIANNSHLSNISFASLTQIGADLVIATNGPNQTISFPQLQSVSSTINICGNIKSLHMPLLKEAFHGFSLISDSPELDCTFYDDLHKQGIIQGVYSCFVLPANWSSVSANTSSVSVGPQEVSHALSTGAKAGIGIGVSGSFMAAFIAALTWLLRARRRAGTKLQELSTEKAAIELSVDGTPEVGLGDYHEKTELEAPRIPQELMAYVAELHGESVKAESFSSQAESGQSMTGKSLSSKGESAQTDATVL